MNTQAVPVNSGSSIYSSSTCRKASPPWPTGHDGRNRGSLLRGAIEAEHGVISACTGPSVCQWRSTRRKKRGGWRPSVRPCCRGHVAENDAWSPRAMRRHPSVCLILLLWSLPIRSRVRASLFRRPAPAVAPEDIDPILRPVGGVCRGDASAGGNSRRRKDADNWTFGLYL